MQDPASNRPQVLKRAEFEADWTGRIVLMARRASLADLGRRFDITWFLQAKYCSRPAHNPSTLPRLETP